MKLRFLRASSSWPRSINRSLSVAIGLIWSVYLYSDSTKDCRLIRRQNLNPLHTTNDSWVKHDDCIDIFILYFSFDVVLSVFSLSDFSPFNVVLLIIWTFFKVISAFSCFFDIFPFEVFSSFSVDPVYRIWRQSSVRSLYHYQGTATLVHCCFCSDFCWAKEKKKNIERNIWTKVTISSRLSRCALVF